MKTSSGSESVRQRLSRLAISAMVAGVGLLVLAPPAAAEIVYTPTNITLPPNTSYNLDVNNDGVTDFTISTSQVSIRCGPSQFGFMDSLVETPASGNGVVGSPPARLLNVKADQIGPSQTFYGGTGTMAWASFCDGQTHAGGSWILVIPPYPAEFKGLSGYLGLMFQINGETHYGWALLSVTLYTRKAPVLVTLTGYAYETIPGAPINPGQGDQNFEITASPISATVSPGQSTTSTLTLAPLDGFSETVTLTCTVSRIGKV
jgi:hypothetical protein